jgi:hypothetical protein
LPSGGLSSLGHTLSTSSHELGLLVTFLSITIILYSTSIYYLEKDALDTKFTYDYKLFFDEYRFCRSIPAAFWWCIVTMTTVGYGDMVPVTAGWREHKTRPMHRCLAAGKLVASFTSISGVVVLAFPITLIVNNFNRVHRASSIPAANRTVVRGGRRQRQVRARFTQCIHLLQDQNIPPTVVRLF